jgi:DNA repair protein RecO (recombination protein O)
MLFTPRITKVHAIVLRAMAWREKDRLLVLLTRERGRIFVIAQGAQRPQNRLAPFAQTGVLATFWLARGREFDRVTDGRWEGIVERLREDVAALAAFGIVAEVLETATPAEMAEAPLFEEVREASLALGSGVPVHKWLTTLLVRLLWHFGWLPHLLTCSVCGEPLREREALFAPSVGGSLCVRCGAGRSLPDAQRVAVATLQGLEALVRQPKLMTTLHLRPTLWEQALSLLRMAWCYHLESDLRAWRVWGQCRKVRPVTPLPRR